MSISNTQVIRMNFFGFTEDVDLIYSSSLPAGKASLDLYTVRSQDAQTTLSGYSLSGGGSEISLFNSSNSYSCSISVENQMIQSLKGSCYVRIVLTLPQDSNIEVYNVGELISPNFFAMSNEVFLQELDQAFTTSAKFEVIDDFLTSYQATNSRPTLISAELDTVLQEFRFSEDRFKVLRKLHMYVEDRNRLREVIQNNFRPSDQGEALEIVGL